ncbi:MAG: precorrin-6A reductase [Candidatus Methanoplasma sp.]|jgi:precorrin-6Y C5,15-methyltransferase (decarboxylating)|nr:precorrin-6A reductase [Candidatus Methanoplasma sp.]
MDEHVALFAGTTEGRELAALLREWGVPTVACVATGFGEGLIEAGGSLRVSSERLGPEGLARVIGGCSVAVDATHPYSAGMTAKIEAACRALGKEYVRVERPAGMTAADGVVEVPSVAAAADFIRGVEGNVLVATGSRDLREFTRVEGYRDRIFARVLSSPSVAAACAEMGFEGRNVFLMQGPFCEELNYGMLVQTGARYLVTKDSGDAGGFREKMDAARRAGATVVLVGRPEKPPGASLGDAADMLADRFGKPRPARAPRRRVTVVGIGVGPGTLTRDGAAAVARADALIGAPRMIEAAGGGRESFPEYRVDRILEYLDANPRIGSAAVLASGDTGFFSVAKELLSKIDRSRYDVDVACGVSSVAYLCSKTGESWDDAVLMSSHARESNVVGAAAASGKVIALLDGPGGASRLCSALSEYGLGEAEVIIGQDLGGEAESIARGRPADLAGMEFGRLCIAMVKNGSPREARSCIPDGEFARGDAPMTKSEVRALSVAKLRLRRDSVVYDVGAGTGSVSVEAALAAPEGAVYSVEREEEAASLIEENARRFSAPNVHAVRGEAPAALEGLPAPTHAFIGGSSGNMREILEDVTSKNPRARIVINSVTLETLSEAISCIREMGLSEEETISVSVSRSKRVGRYHFMNAQNTVYITVCDGIAPRG